MKQDKELQKFERRIKRIKERLSMIGEMRPGSLSTQYNVCGSPNCRCKDPVKPKKHGPYYQLSYVHRGKSTSQFIRKESLSATKRQVVEYKKFRRLVDEWVELALQHARLQLELERKKS